jgi:hypothetical protein
MRVDPDSEPKTSQLLSRDDTSHSVGARSDLVFNPSLGGGRVVGDGDRNKR